MAKRKLDFAESSINAWFLIVLALYLVRIMPWAMAELWYDEVITLGDYVFDPKGHGFWHIFRNYPVANNHILSSAVYWLWVRFIDFNITAEHLLRMPSMAFGGMTIALVMYHWRLWLGNRIAILGGLLLAISPVFTAYAYQVRGYSLSILLAAIALSGTLEIVSGRRGLGHTLAVITMLLLPLVIPSNVILAPVLALLIAVALWHRGHNWWQCIGHSLPVLIAAAIGFSYYFSIWELFLAASREPGGWSSAWLVAGNLCLATLAHAGLFAGALAGVLYMLLRKKHFWNRQSPLDLATSLALEAVPGRPTRLLLRPMPVIMASTVGCLIVVAAVLLVSRSGQTPYPRVFLVFLPVITFAALFSGRSSTILRRWSFGMLALLVICNGFIWERAAEALTDIQLQSGHTPNNLLQQYYRGADELRYLSSLLAEQQWLENATALTDAYDFPTFRMYWQLAGGQRGKVIAVNQIPANFRLPPPSERFWIIARNADHAADLLQQVIGVDSDLIKQRYNQPGGLTNVASYRRRGLYVPYLPQPPKVEKKPSRRGGNLA